MIFSSNTQASGYKEAEKDEAVLEDIEIRIG